MPISLPSSVRPILAVTPLVLLLVSAACQPTEEQPDDTEEADTDVDTDVDTGPFDADGDGYPPSRGDCDDTDPSVHPGAKEVCDNRVDDNCDGSPLPCGLRGAIDLGAMDAKWVGEAADDHAGKVLAARDTNADGLVDLLVGAAGADGVGQNSGAAYLVLGPMSGVADLSSAAARFLGEAEGDAAGTSVALGDIDGDAVPDVLLGAPFQDAVGTSSGAAYLVLGPVETTNDLALADARLSGETAGDRAGLVVAAGDIDGDGSDELLAGASGDDSGGPDGGAVYLVDGPLKGLLDLSSASAKWFAEEAGDGVGYAVAAGDVDGDGHDDVLVGAPYQGAGGPAAGAAYLVLGPAKGVLDLASADTKLVGEAPGDYAGNPVAMGDTDGDGIDEMLVGAFGEDSGGSSAGAVYVIRSSVSGTVDLSAAGAKLVGAIADDSAGWSMATADVDGEGVEALLVGATGSDGGGSSAGAVHLVRGPLEGTLLLAASDAILVGENPGDNAGDALATGDVDGDGYEDVLIGAGAEDSGGWGAGAVYLVAGEGY